MIKIVNELFILTGILLVLASINMAVVTWRELWELLEKKNRKI